MSQEIGLVSQGPIVRSFSFIDPRRSRNFRLCFILREGIVNPFPLNSTTGFPLGLKVRLSWVVNFEWRTSISRRETDILQEMGTSKSNRQRERAYRAL